MPQVVRGAKGGQTNAVNLCIRDAGTPYPDRRRHFGKALNRCDHRAPRMAFGIGFYSNQKKGARSPNHTHVCRRFSRRPNGHRRAVQTPIAQGYFVRGHMVTLSKIGWVTFQSNAMSYAPAWSHTQWIPYRFACLHQRPYRRLIANDVGPGLARQPDRALKA